MLDKFNYGLKRAFSELIPEIAIPITVSIFISARHFPSYSIWFFHLVSIVDMIVFIQKMPYWATSYIIGWLVGIIILATTGLLTILDFLIYLIPIGFIVYKRYK